MMQKLPLMGGRREQADKLSLARHFTRGPRDPHRRVHQITLRAQRAWVDALV